MFTQGRIAVLFCLSASLAVSAIPTSSQAASAPKSTALISGGIWRVDAGFTSSIQLNNRLVTKGIAVVPALFMADGARYDLPAVYIPRSGTATIDVKSALAAAPSALAGHISDFGSVSLRYGSMPSALIAQTSIVSVALSESFISPFTSAMPGVPAPQVLEGLWWARKTERWRIRYGQQRCC